MDDNAQRRAAARRRIRLTERDERVLQFAVEHRFVLVAHVQALLETTAAAADSRLRRLTRARYTRRERPIGAPSCYLTDRKALRALGSDLSRPADVDMRLYKHDVGVAWLWLAAKRGAFGSIEVLTSERRMRSHDAHLEGEAPLDGRPLLGAGRRAGLHYPDLVMQTPGGHRVAVELELTTKSRVRREQILGAYAIDRRIDAVLYLVQDPRISREIEASAAAIGVSSMVRVERIAFGPPAGAGVQGGRVLERGVRRDPGVRGVDSVLGR